MGQTNTISNKSDCTHLSLKQIVDNAIDDFMTKEPDGLFEKTHDMIHILFSLFIEVEDKKDESLLIDHQTTILGIPADRNRVSQYKSWLDEDPPTSNIYELGYYIEDLNLIMYGGGATHRLAALNLYYRDQHPPFIMNERNLIRCAINTERLNRYNLYENGQILYWLDTTDPLNTIYRKELTPLMFDMIANLQIHYFGQAKFIDEKEEKKFCNEWQNREKSPFDRAQELLNKY
ncbi:MAG: hypothetical protein PHT07_10180 [Paludibacter sp.]|nr:hypothetical protein [Paludibacter sp.]